MQTPYERYRHELDLSDREPKTKARYWQIITAYRTWHEDAEPDVLSVREYIAHLRDQGYAQSSITLYYHALRMFLDFLGLELRLRLRKRRTLPPYHPWADLARLIEETRRGYP